MSAFILSDEEINTLVSYFITPVLDKQLYCKLDGEYNYINEEKAARLASVLMNQNVASVNARYNDNTKINYTFTLDKRAWAESVANINNIIRSYDYNACETEDYYTTEAYYIICRMREHLLNNLCDKGLIRNE